MKPPGSTASFLKRLLGVDSLVGNELISDQMHRYKVLEKIGEGGMGSVYKAFDQNGKEVAIKITITDQGFMRFKLETAILKLLGQHANLPELFDWGLEKSAIKFCVMEYVEGETLDRVIRKQSDWFYQDPLLNTLDVGVGLLSALSHVHRKKVVHRDVKPHNIIINRMKRNSAGYKLVKLMDFGVAKMLEKGFLSFLHRSIRFDERTLTLPGQPIGTLGYAPREQLDNSPIDESADIFSVGVTMLEMVHGQTFFTCSVLSEYLKLLENFVFEPFQFPRESEYVVGRLNEILQKALAKDPHARYNRAEKMLRELQPLRDEIAKRRWAAARQ